MEQNRTPHVLPHYCQSGSRYFCESFYGHPCPTSGKNYATANAFGGPSRPASLVAYPTRGMQHRYRNDSTRFRKACIFTTQKTLRENTCPIASGDYSTPVSQRGNRLIDQDPLRQNSESNGRFHSDWLS